MESNKEALRRLIRESLMQEHLNLIEGIDIDEKTKIVSFNNSHENNVDTSTLINPTYNSINDIDVISIFKRKKTNDFSFDGNPLIYALKGINGWKFKNSQSDITNLLKQFIRISEKIQSNYNTIITIPSQNQLNTQFLYRLNKIIKSDFQIDDYLHKLTAEEVYEDFVNWNQLGIDFGNKYDKIKNILNSYFKDMTDNSKGYFSYKFIKNVNLRKYITKTMYSDVEKTIEYAHYINEKNILILDDTIGSGQTISEGCKEILDMFTPKSITVITLFSKL
jgi:hypothetical protein